MIKKIQNYLLTHHPIIWNIKLIPMILVLLGIHAIFFTIGFASAQTSFEDLYSYYYSPFNNMEILYLVSVLIGIIALIGWLVFYNRNNGLKIFYPKKTSQIYLEWSLCLIITIGLATIPFSMTEGYLSKWRSIASKSETEKAIATLQRAEVLIPNTDYYRFSYSTEYNKPIPVPEGMNLRPDSIDFDDFSIQYSGSGGLIIRGYTGQSLLFFSSYGYEDYHEYKDKPLEIMKKVYIDSTTWEKHRRQNEVKEWIKNGEKDKILSVMKDFENLQRKHNLVVNITPEKWLERIYIPPFFPVNQETLIKKNQPNSIYDNTYYSDDDIFAVETVDAVSDHQTSSSKKTIPFLQYDELENGYNQISKSHEEDIDIQIFLLICICIATWTSLFIFSFRVTDGKSWLISLVGTGLLLFAILVGTVAILDTLDWGRNDERIFVMLILLFWVALFIGLGIRILTKIIGKKHKGNSKYYINLFIWLIPCQIPLLFFTFALYTELQENYLDISEEMIMNMFWLNILFICLIMWPISVFVRKWKAIAEE
ncbi:hypothetical protein [Dysgonomonas sp. Marseille-P4361]|uniref:hypothetical protein n=1 Tax=Dysgonomonas sp. Marseille-P4361 TaxID=2161820 RepID=UPI000D5611C0|nr:hypothetical protein [Dysgonomonas sp. Marseille-P4361]